MEGKRTGLNVIVFFFHSSQTGSPTGDFKIVLMVSSDAQPVTKEEEKARNTFREQAKEIYEAQMAHWEEKGEKLGKPKPQLDIWQYERTEPLREAEQKHGILRNAEVNHYVHCSE